MLTFGSLLLPLPAPPPGWRSVQPVGSVVRVRGGVRGGIRGVIGVVSCCIVVVVVGHDRTGGFSRRGGWGACADSSQMRITS